MNGLISVKIPAEGKVIAGDLFMSPGVHAVIVFAHGSGSSRFSPRNKMVANFLNDNGFATLMIDLLTEEEERVDVLTGEFRFDIDLLTKRLISAADWLKEREQTAGLKVGFFGASTGAAAALKADARMSGGAFAIVSRGGRPDLAGEEIDKVKAPTLLIVGGNDQLVIEINKESLARLNCEKEMVVIANATHLFEEPGALEEVAGVAGGWYRRHLGA